MSAYSMFESRKGQELFLELSESLMGEEKAEFTKSVKKLYDAKITSEEGVYDVFKITEEDVKAIWSYGKFGRVGVAV